jgi:hypothetical protein
VPRSEPSSDWNAEGFGGMTKFYRIDRFWNPALA